MNSNFQNILFLRGSEIYRRLLFSRRTMPLELGLRERLRRCLPMRIMSCNKLLPGSFATPNPLLVVIVVIKVRPVFVLLVCTNRNEMISVF